MIEKYFFAWVTEYEAFDEKQHAKKELNVIKMHIVQKKGDLFASVKMILPLIGEMPTDKFLFISMQTDDGIIPVIKCRPVSVMYGQWNGTTGFIVELHAKSYEFDSDLNTTRASKNFDHRFLLNNAENRLIDFRLMVDKCNLNILNHDYKPEKKTQENKLQSFFPNTILNYQKNPGVKKLTVNMKLNWIFKDEKEIDIGARCLKNLSTPNVDLLQLSNSFVLPGSMFGEVSVVSAQMNDVFFNFEGTAENLVPKTELDLSVLVKMTQKIARTENIILKIDSGVDEKKCNVIDQEITFNICLDEYVGYVQKWCEKVEYLKDDVVLYYGKRYKSLVNHQSDLWKTDKDKWVCLTDEFLMDNEISVACNEYGYKLVENALYIVQQFLAYTNNVFITKVQLPLEQLLKMDYGKYVWLEREFCTRGGNIISWELYADGTKTNGWIEMAEMLSSNDLDPPIFNNDDHKAFSDEYCDDGYTFKPKIIKHNDFVYMDYGWQHPMIDSLDVITKKAKTKEIDGRFSVYADLETHTKRKENTIKVEVKKVS